MRHYEFKVTLRGCGESIDEAWADAVDSFAHEPVLCAPEDQWYTVDRIVLLGIEAKHEPKKEEG